MNIRKLPSGSYQIRQTSKGRVYSVTVPFKPTEKKAYELIQEKINHPAGKYDGMTFTEAYNKYIKIKDKVISPSTKRSYKSLHESLPMEFKKLKLDEIDQTVVQQVINDYTEGHSPKTVRNMHGFISAVLTQFKEITLNTTLPQKKIVEKYIPTIEEVKTLMDYVRPTQYYVAICLAAMSLRRSEICALTLDDLNGNTLTIDKAMVFNTDGEWEIKMDTKTTASTRTVIISDELADRIREQGYIYEGFPGSITQYLKKALKRLGIQEFTLHSLRHFFSSYAHELGYSDQAIQSAGGWQTDYVMKRVYRHAMNQEEAQKNMAQDFGKLL